MAKTLEDEEQNVDLMPSEKVETSGEERQRWYTINKESIPCKFAYFLAGSKVGCSTPFINPFLVDVGLSPSQAGLIAGLRLIGSMLGSVVFGMIMDYTQRYQIVLVVISICATSIMVPLPWLPTLVKHDNSTCLLKSNTSLKSISKVTNCSVKDEPNVLFIAFLGAYVLFSFFDGYIFPFIDSAAMNLVAKSKKKVNVGLQRVFAPIGYGFTTLIASALFKSIQNNMDISEYSIQHFLYALVAISLIINSHTLLSKAKLQKKSRVTDDNLTKVLLKTIMCPRVIFFLSTVFLHGVFVSANNSFLLVLMKTFSPPDLLFGVATCLASASALLIYPFAVKLVKRLGGPFPTMLMAFTINVARFITYGFSPNVYLIIIVQGFTHGLCISVFNIASMLKTQEISPENIRSTMFGITSALYLSAGGIVSNIVGGAVIETYDVKVLFKGIATVSAIWSLLIFIHVLYDRSISLKEKDTTEADEEML